MSLDLENSKNKKISFSKFLEEFYTRPQHNWILQDNEILNHFYPFLLKQNIEILHKKDIYFLRLKDEICSTFSPQTKKNYILIFPELYQLIKSEVYEYGYAILAHEIGHLVYNHSEKNICSIQAQIEADQYAYSIGYGKHLIAILKDNLDVSGTKERISSLLQLEKKS